MLNTMCQTPKVGNEEKEIAREKKKKKTNKQIIL